LSFVCESCKVVVPVIEEHKTKDDLDISNGVLHSVSKKQPPLLAGCYLVKLSDLILIFFGRHIPKGCQLKMMLLIPTPP